MQKMDLQRDSLSYTDVTESTRSQQSRRDITTQQNNIWETLWKNFISLIGVCLVCWSMTSDILLIYHVYYEDDFQFFVVGTTFLCAGIICFEAMAIHYSCFNDNTDKDRFSCLIELIQLVPVLNIPLILYYDSKYHDHRGMQSQNAWITDKKISFLVPGAGSSMFQAVISFPLYILNVSFILSKKSLQIWNILQLISSLITLMISPALYSWSMWRPEQENYNWNSCQPELEQYRSNTITLSHRELRIEREKYQQQHTLSNSKKICLRLKAALKMLFYLGPVMSIEIIHFFPLLFEYYYYENITYAQFVDILLLFNLPKLLIIFVVGTDGQFLVSNILGGCIESGCMCWVIMWILVPIIILPLLPWQLCIVSHDEPQAKHGCVNLVVLFLYFVISYGGMIGFLWINGMGQISFILSIALTSNIVFVCVLDMFSLLCFDPFQWHEYLDA